jgi:hypothetical protein
VLVIVVSILPILIFAWFARFDRWFGRGSATALREGAHAGADGHRRGVYRIARSGARCCGSSRSA